MSTILYCYSNAIDCHAYIPSIARLQHLVRLEPDVVELFPNADAVNEALRFLARITRENRAS